MSKENSLAFEYIGVQRPFKKIQNRWDQCANIWSIHLFESERSLASAALAIEPYILALPPEANILEIAAGSNNSIYYPENFNMSRVTAVDASPEMMQLNPSGHKIIADVRKRLEFPSSSFSLALCMFGMRYLENQEEVLENMHRVVIPEQWVVCIDYYNAWHDDAVRVFDINQLSKFASNLQVQQVVANHLIPVSKEIAQLDFLALQK